MPFCKGVQNSMETFIDGFLSYFFEPAIRIEKVVAAYSISLDALFVFNGERHNFWEFSYVYSGGIDMSLNGTDAIHLSENEFFIVSPGQFHSCRCSSEEGAHMLTIAFECSSEAMSYYKNYKGYIAPEERETIKKILFYSADVFSDGGLIHSGGINFIPINPNQTIGSGQCMINYFELLLIEHIRTVEKYPVYNISKANRKQLIAINIMRYIDTAYDQNIDLTKLSKVFHFSPSYLMNLFKACTGKCIGEYITSVKTQHAKDMLINTDLSLGDISECLGQSSAQYFSYFFRKQTGLSPSEYRKERSKKTGSSV